MNLITQEKPTLDTARGLEDLVFENTFARELPGEPVLENVPRQVRHAAYTRVEPTAGSLPCRMGAQARRRCSGEGPGQQVARRQGAWTQQGAALHAPEAPRPGGLSLVDFQAGCRILRSASAASLPSRDRLLSLAASELPSPSGSYSAAEDRPASCSLALSIGDAMNQAIRDVGEVGRTA